MKAQPSPLGFSLPGPAPIRAPEAYQWATLAFN